MILKGMNCDAFLMQDCYRIYLEDILKTEILKRGKKNTQVIYLHDKEQLILLLFMEARLLLQEVY